MRTFCIVTNTEVSATLRRFAQGLQQEMEKNGYLLTNEQDPDLQLVFNFVDPKKPRHFRRRGQGTFVVAITEQDQPTDNVLKSGYPIMIRSLANMMIYLDHSRGKMDTYFITLEQGHYPIPGEIDDEHFFRRIFDRLRPLATAELIINNQFNPDLAEELWEGNHVTQQINRAGKQLDRLNLLPTPFPIQELLPEKEMRHIEKLYGIGGLSYGNLSARQEENRFWMSASGVNKSRLKQIGQDILMIKGYDQKNKAMQISIPPHVKPRRASVDAIEHWMIYTEHPNVGAIVHIHAWMDNIQSTEINYPCGTLQLAEAVAEQIRQAEDPSQAVVGLKNHGLTITGHDLDDIFERIEGRIIPQVPMS